MIDDFVLEIIIFAFFPNYFNHVRNNHKMEIKSAIQITFFARGNAWMSKVDIKLGCQQGWQLGCQLKFLLDVNWMSTWMSTWMSIQKKKHIIKNFVCN